MSRPATGSPEDGDVLFVDAEDDIGQRRSGSREVVSHCVAIDEQRHVLDRVVRRDGLESDHLEPVGFDEEERIREEAEDVLTCLHVQRYIAELPLDTHRARYRVGALTAEPWLRYVWKDAPTGLRAFLRLGWKFGLGLRLGPADPSHVLGWHIDASTGRTVMVSARSRILSGTNTLTVEDNVIRWQTDVRYDHVVGRLVWPPAALVHQRIVTCSVRRAIHSLESRG